MKATLPEPEIITRKGKPVSVILPIKRYEELLERVEDAEDIAWLKRARQNRCVTSRSKTIWRGENPRPVYRILLEHAAEKNLSRLPTDAHDRVIAAIQGLARNPRPPGCRKR